MSGGKEYVVRYAVSEKQSHGYAHLCLLFRQVNDRLNFLVYNAKYQQDKQIHIWGMRERLIAVLLRQQFVMLFEKYALDIIIITAAWDEEFYVSLPQNWTLEAALKSEIIIQIKYLCTIELYRQELFYPNQSTDCG